MFSAFLVFAALWTVVDADGQNSLTGKFREDITLNITGAAQLHGAYEIIWSHVRKLLIYYDNGEWIKNATQKYQLDAKTGSLTIRSLIANDSGLYQVQIVIGNKRTPETFNLTVVDPDPNPPTGPPQLLWIIAVLFLLALVVCVVLAIIKSEQIKGIFRGRFTPCDPEDPGNTL